MEQCNDCESQVGPEDLYYATLCGTYCDECMELHAHDCAGCRNEFDIDIEENQ